jgi:hypothetical protein
MNMDHIREILLTVDAKQVVRKEELYMHLNFSGVGLNDFNKYLSTLIDMDVLHHNANDYIKKSVHFDSAKKLIVKGDFL